MKPKVVVAMSGGVDSSVAAALLLEQGYQVIGITLRLWPEDEAVYHHHPCCLTEDVNDARGVCRKLGIPYYVLNFEPLFQRWVVDYFCEEYTRGRTPNPCLACNQEIKFRFLLARVLALGCDFLATGHYARIVSANGEYRLLKGVDPRKDQSYVLFTLGQQELKHLLMPLGDWCKEEVRLKARELGLRVAEKEESQEICFVLGDYRDFLAERLAPAPGEIVDGRGRRLGSHPGIAFFTVGQRRGLCGSPLEPSSHARPLYVIKIDPGQNRLMVGPEEELYAPGLWAGSVTWIAGEPPPGLVAATARVRYRSPEAPARLWPQGEGVRVEFDLPQKAIAPGQAVVFYRGEEVLGGGIIDEVIHETYLRGRGEATGGGVPLYSRCG